MFPCASIVIAPEQIMMWLVLDYPLIILTKQDWWVESRFYIQVAFVYKCHSLKILAALPIE